MIICGILARAIVNNKAWKTNEYLDIKNSSCEKRPFGKLALDWKMKYYIIIVCIIVCIICIIIIETLLNNKNVACAKSNYLIHTTSLMVICLLLLVVICVTCYFYYKKYQSKQKHLLPFHDTSIKLKILILIFK